MQKSENAGALFAALSEAQRANNHHAERHAIQALYRRTARAGCQNSKIPLHERLFNRVVFGTTDCWHWCGPTNTFGYGRMTYQGRLQVAHRLSWIAFNGPIPDGLSVLHKCDNPSCINPEHLWLGTYSDNIKDAYQKGRRQPVNKKRH